MDIRLYVVLFPFRVFGHLHMWEKVVRYSLVLLRGLKKGIDKGKGITRRHMLGSLY